MSDKNQDLIREIDATRKLFAKENTKKVLEFDDLSFRLWVEAKNQARHEDWLRVNTEISETNMEVVKLNKRTNELNERYIQVLEKIEKHLVRLVK
jgi:hypothetical protein